MAQGTHGTDADLVELVDDQGSPAGEIPKLAAHQPPGALHRAFSVFLFDLSGRLLLQKRAAGKYHSPGLWSNTCCGHPWPGEDPAVAAARRLREELGVDAGPLMAAGLVSYQVTDPVSGLVEHEWNHLFVGRVVQEPEPDPAEVAEYAFVPLDGLARFVETHRVSAWFPVVWQAVTPALEYLP
ncbi:isopentenyl-diphosphate Delta-isomerase [Carbonactinospora thermoautotrophica]|nr:isopentenyl-diphosphate Delta-isomerase [Carbonactinospora thermoautotrophica]MCX9193354.1 isopentenyl-diphosphate Delta-isomerase [Carbonactinospora thermoautotrophica]